VAQRRGKWEDDFISLLMPPSHDVSDSVAELQANRGVVSRTDTLAIWGAVTGTLGAFLALLSYRRDRVKLMVRGMPLSRGKPRQPWFRTQVVNEGRQPVMITMLLILSRLPFRYRIRLFLFYQWARFLLPLLVPDKDKRMHRMAERFKSTLRTFKPIAVYLAVPAGLDDGEVTSRLGVPETSNLPALVKPGDLFVHDRQLSRWEAESLLDFDKLRTVVIDARNRRVSGPITLPKLHKVTPLVKRRGWTSAALVKTVQQDWRRLIDSAYAEDEDGPSLGVEHPDRPTRGAKDTNRAGADASIQR
jgi:hypothetical protein